MADPTTRRTAAAPTSFTVPTTDAAGRTPANWECRSWQWCSSPTLLAHGCAHARASCPELVPWPSGRGGRTCLCRPAGLECWHPQCLFGRQAGLSFRLRWLASDFLHSWLVLSNSRKDARVLSSKTAGSRARHMEGMTNLFPHAVAQVQLQICVNFACAGPVVVIISSLPPPPHHQEPQRPG